MLTALLKALKQLNIIASNININIGSWDSDGEIEITTHLRISIKVEV